MNPTGTDVNPFFELGLFVVLVGGFVGFILYLYKKDQARRATLKSFAATQGFGYLARASDRTSLFGSPPFGMGVARTAEDLVFGHVDGTPFETFAYQFKTRDANANGHTRTQKHPYQVTWIPLPASIPTMRLTADNAVLRWGRMLGARDLDTESDEFNRQWKVWCEDERVGHAVLTPRMIEYLLRSEAQGRSYVIEGRALMTYRAGFTDATETPRLVSVLARIAELIPPFLIERDATPRSPGSR